MLYDGTCMQQQTKASIEAEIQNYKDMITDIQNNNQYSDDGKQGYIDEYQSHIDELQENTRRHRNLLTIIHIRLTTRSIRLQI